MTLAQRVFMSLCFALSLAAPAAAPTLPPIDAPTILAADARGQLVPQQPPEKTSAPRLAASRVRSPSRRRRPTPRPPC